MRRPYSKLALIATLFLFQYTLSSQSVEVAASETQTIEASTLSTQQANNARVERRTKQDYTLVWSDEFGGNGAINDANWFHQTQLPSGGNWYNGELQHYTDRIKNSFLADGNLNIKAIKESFNDQGSTKQYTSARLNSKFAFTYGRVDVRAKLPSGDGTWPAIWMLGKNINEPGGYWSQQFGTVNWPATGEIDIMEHWGNNPNVIHGSTHTTSSSGATVNTGKITATDVSNTFHIYSIIWDEDKIQFLIDDNNYYTYQPAVKDAATWPFDKPQYILLNIAMGGIGGAIDPNFTTSSMELDYVRVYQTGTNGNTDSAPTVGAPSPISLNSDVIAIYSDKYTPLPGTNFNPNWNQSTKVSATIIGGNNTLKYENFDYQGIELQNSIDVTDMDMLHVDFWTANSSQFGVYLISSNALENVSPLTITPSTWMSVDIPLTDFTVPALNDIAQLKFEGNGTIYIDNIYFLKKNENGQGSALSYTNIVQKIYAHDQFLHINGSESMLNAEVMIYDLLGRAIQQFSILEKSSTIKLNETGILVVHLKRAGQQPINLKIINN